MLRWAVNVGAWLPSGGAEGDEWRFLAGLLPAVRPRARRARSARTCDARDTQEASAKVGKFVHVEDKKRALCRCSCAPQANGLLRSLTSAAPAASCCNAPRVNARLGSPLRTRRWRTQRAGSHTWCALHAAPPPRLLLTPVSSGERAGKPAARPELELQRVARRHVRALRREQVTTERGPPRCVKHRKLRGACRRAVLRVWRRRRCAWAAEAGRGDCPTFDARICSALQTPVHAQRDAAHSSRGRRRCAVLLCACRTRNSFRFALQLRSKTAFGSSGASRRHTSRHAATVSRWSLDAPSLRSMAALRVSGWTAWNSHTGARQQDASVVRLSPLCRSFTMQQLGPADVHGAHWVRTACSTCSGGPH